MHAPDQPVAVASRRHTVRLAAVFLVIGAVGAGLRLRAGIGGEPPAVGRANLSLLYASLGATEWLLFRGVRAGLASTRTPWRALIGRPLRGTAQALSDLLIGVAVAGAWVSAALAAGSSGPRTLLPDGAVEWPLWIGLAVSAGFCEEFAFRGYFQRQFGAMTRSRAWGLVLQAALFGVAHAYQGVHSALAIAAYGLVLGMIAQWRGSLRAGIVAHTVTDVLLGFLGR